MAVEGMMKCGGVGDQHDDMGDGMQCSDHPYRSNPGGICAFCLQEKLGKLVSSSFPLPVVRASSSSSASSPNSFRSDHLSVAGETASKSRTRANNGNATGFCNNSNSNNNMPFLLSVVMAKKKKKKVATTAAAVAAAAAASSSSSSSDHVVFKRSKSTATPRRGCRFAESANDDFSPRKRGGFWSFLHLSSYSMSSSSSSARNSKTASFSSATSAGLTAARQHHQREKRGVVESASSSVSVVVLEENDNNNNNHHNGTASPNGQTASFERKVSRSRSVGCGSRSFSGDFFERISTGFGDCTLRRVESQREGKPSTTNKHAHARDGHCMKERVRCGGLFGGFILTSSYWDEVNGPKSGPGPLVHGRSRSWGWAFASPIRAFTKPSGPNNHKRDNISNNNNSKSSTTAATTPNLAAIPSLLAVRG